MKNQQPSSEKNCYTCKRRRIKCDGGAPGCLKCSRKGLICPGYGPRLRWAGGAAVRGYLAQSRELGSPSRSRIVNTDWVEQFALTNKELHKLVEHWANKIAPLMVWIDSDENPYRLFITPLAYSNPVVGLAMAAVSSQHASKHDEDTTFSEKARNKAIELISSYIKDVTDLVMSGHELSNTLDDNSLEAVLAAMLLLSNYEMTNTGAAASEFHRRAARSLVNTFQTTGRSGSALFSFLRNQLCVHDVFACTTSFDLSTMEDVIIPDIKDQSVLFSTYLTYLHDITLLSRRLLPSSDRWNRMGLSFRHIMAQFEIARGDTTMTAGAFSLRPDNRRRDFIRVTNIYFYAALLFAIRCLQLDIHEQRKQELIDSLFDQLSNMHSADEWLHALPWPLFIAGVEVHNNKGRQDIISDLYGRTCKLLRYHNFHEALSFLRNFWVGANTDWRKLAHSWELAGHPVLLP